MVHKIPLGKSQPNEQPELRDGQDAGRVFASFYTQRDHEGENGVRAQSYRASQVHGYT